MSYKWVSKEMFEEKLEEILGEMSGESILMIPGVYKLVEQYFEDEINEELEAENFPNLMSYEAVNESFKSLIEDSQIPPDDAIWLREEWNDFTDVLCKDKLITPDNYEDWENPY